MPGNAKHCVSLLDLCQLFERLHDGAFFWNADLKLIACNEYGCRLAGLDPAFMTPGRDYDEMIAAMPPGRFARRVSAGEWMELHDFLDRQSVLDDFRNRVDFEVRLGGDHPRVLIGSRAIFREGVLATLVTDVTDREESARAIERERSYLATIIDNLEVGVALFDEEDRLVASNRGLSDLYEISPAAVEPGASLERVARGIGLLDRMTEAEREREIERWGAWARDRAPGSATAVDELPDGRSIEVARIGLGDGRRVFVSRDVTEGVEIARQRTELAAIVENIEEGALLLDLEGRFVACNARFLDHYVVEPGSIRPGDHITRMTEVERDLDGLPPVEQKRRRAERVDFAVRHSEGRAEARRVLGTGRVLAITRIPFQDKVLFTYRDVTADEERKRLLDQARRDAEEASRMQSEFLARMSHELRTPMQGVLGMAALLERSKLDAHQQQCLNVIGASGRHMLELIENLLTSVTLGAGALSIQTTPVLLTELVEEVVEILRMQAEEKGLSLGLDMGPLAGLLVEADATRLRQVLINLLGNAVRYTQAGAVVLRAAATRMADGLVAVEIAVEDTGPGIPEDKREEIFRRFRQLEPTQGGVKEGVGLGLPIARSLAVLMGGDIAVESRQGGGATFTFRFTASEAARAD